MEGIMEIPNSDSSKECGSEINRHQHYIYEGTQKNVVDDDGPETEMHIN